MIYYINFDGAGINVFDSQVLTPIRLMRKKHIEVKLINFDSNMKSDAYRQKIKAVETELEDKVFSIKKLNIGFVVLPRYVKTIARIVRETNKDELVTFHCRNAFAGYLALKVKKILKGFKVKVITDFRGAMAEECRLVYSKRGILFRMAMPFVAKRLAHIEKTASHGSDFRFFVSNRLKEYMKGRYPFKTRMSEVIPTCIDSQKFKFDEASRNEMRKQLGIENRTVFIYSGSTREWQVPDKLAGVFAQIGKQIGNAFFLILSRDNNTFETCMKAHGIDEADYRITSCKHSDVNKYLSCGDMAILLREQDIVNKVSSPTKFAEYISCHLPVILSKNIGDTDKIINQYRVGVFESEIPKLNQELIQRISRTENFEMVIDRYYDWNKKIGNIIGIYSFLGYSGTQIKTTGVQISNDNDQEKAYEPETILP